METIVRCLGHMRFEATARGYRVIRAQTAEKHGEDSGMSPPEFLLVSFAKE
jgi:hypothetical protein